MQKTQYDQAFMFAYSEREKTHAARHLNDDVPAEVKSRRLQEIITAFREGQLKKFQAEVGRTHLVSCFSQHALQSCFTPTLLTFPSQNKFEFNHLVSVQLVHVLGVSCRFGIYAASLIHALHQHYHAYVASRAQH